MAERRTITLAEVDTSRPNRVGVKDSENRWYGVFDRKLWDRLTVGASLNVDVTTSERDGRTYYNIAGILGTTPTTNGHAAPTSDRERNIIRESALSSACSVAAFLDVSDGNAVAAILRCADQFAAWIVRKDDEDIPF